MMKSSEYWQKRFELLEQAAHKQGVQCYADIEKQYRQAQKQLEGQIAAWYQRFASNNGVTLAEAKRMLNAKELAELKWDVNQYIQYGQENAINGTWVKQLENASARFHISRLEALKLQTQQSIEVMFGNQLDSIDNTMRNVYKSGYYHTAYEIQKGVGVGWDFSALDDKQISKVINKPWAVDGKNFSERIWGNRQKLVNELNNTLTQNIILGKDPQKAIDEIARKMNTSKTNAGRLVMTEEAFFSSAAQKDCFAELDVEMYEIVATLDSHTSDICRGMDGKHFHMSEWKVGVTAPPFHVHCRSTTVPYFDDEFDTVGERAARDEETGKTYFVPGNMTYKEWDKAFVQGDKSDLKKAKPDDTIKVQEKISDQNTKIDDLKQQFSDITEGYSYDEWFSEFDSIEDGFGEITENDVAQATKLKDLDEQIRKADSIKTDLLLQKDRRGQVDTGFTGRIPNDKLDEYNKKGFEQIKVDTGYTDEEAKKFQESLLNYFGGDYDAILKGEGGIDKVISDGIDRMPVYDGSIYRGMVVTNSEAQQYTELVQGDTLPSRGMFASWSSNVNTAISYGGYSSYERSSVVLECVDNQTGVGVQHLSLFNDIEAEVLSNANYEVVEVVKENKYDFLKKHQEYLYSPDDLEENAEVLRGQVICRIKVKEIH